MTFHSAKSFRSTLVRLLQFFAVIEVILLLALTIWAGYLYLSLAKLTEPVLAWAIRLACVVGASAAVWQSYKFARQRRFRYSLRMLLIVMCALGVLLGMAANYVTRFREQQAAGRAVSYIQSLNVNGTITIGSPNHATAEERMDWTDLRNATSVSFSGTTLVESDYAQLAKVPNLASITIKNAPIDVEGLSLLRHLPNLQFFVFENTSASDSTLKKIEDINSKWRVFKSQDELKQWSLARVKKIQAGGEP